jgi:hypothetical protein
MQAQNGFGTYLAFHCSDLFLSFHKVYPTHEKN